MRTNRPRQSAVCGVVGRREMAQRGILKLKAVVDVTVSELQGQKLLFGAHVAPRDANGAVEVPLYFHRAEIGAARAVQEKTFREKNDRANEDPRPYSRLADARSAQGQREEPGKKNGAESRQKKIVFY